MFQLAHDDTLAVRGEMFCKRTNRQNKGLISVDRSNKATLLLTIPRSKFKSSAKDLSRPIFEIVFQRTTKAACFATPARLNFMALELHRQLYLCACNKGQGKYCRFLAWILT